MGLDLSYIAAEKQLDLRLRQVDWEILGILGKACPDALDVIAGVEDFGEARTERRLDLLKAVETVFEQLERQSDSLPYVYGFTITEGLARGISGPGGVGGITIGGDGFFYSIQAGLGHCVLEKRGLGPDGKVFVAERRDITNIKILKTDNMGEIKISRKKKKTQLKEALLQIKDFLSESTVESITKILG